METNLQIHKHIKTATCSSHSQQKHYEWVSSDVPSDITIEVDGVSLAMHKFPLASRSGRIRKLISENRSVAGIPIFIQLHDVPGGVESFVLAAKFCYGVHFDITSANIAQLRCVSGYLEMIESYSKGNLISRCEHHLESITRNSFDLSIEVLQHCVSLLPIADELKIASRCTDSIADHILTSLSDSEIGSDSVGMQTIRTNTRSENWWIGGLSSLSIDMYQGVISTLRCRGMKPESIGSSLVNYAQNELIHKPRIRQRSTHLSKVDPPTPTSHERAVVEIIVWLLPVERSAIPISFLFGLLRSATMLDCTASCCGELERRIGLRLDEASVDDLLMPWLHHADDVLFDVGMVQRMLINFCRHKNKEDEAEEEMDDNLPTQTAIIKVSKLMDDYLAEIAPDPNLKLDQFLDIAQGLPAHARIVHDGLYRAVDIYFKGHEGLPESDQKKLCKLINFQLLTPEAGSHAAQNERLPVRSIIQVLYYEQLRMRNALFFTNGEEISKTVIQQRQQLLQPLRFSTGNLSESMVSPCLRDNYASLRWENRELKLELARLRMRLNDLERQHLRRSKVDRSPSITLRSILKNLLPIGSAWASTPRNSKTASRNAGR